MGLKLYATFFACTTCYDFASFQQQSKINAINFVSEPISAKSPTIQADNKFIRIERREHQPMALFCNSQSFPIPVFRFVMSKESNMKQPAQQDTPNVNRFIVRQQIHSFSFTIMSWKVKNLSQFVSVIVRETTQNTDKIKRNSPQLFEHYTRRVLSFYFVHKTKLLRVYVSTFQHFNISTFQL